MMVVGRVAANKHLWKECAPPLPLPPSPWLCVYAGLCVPVEGEVNPQGSFLRSHAAYFPNKVSAGTWSLAIRLVGHRAPGTHLSLPP